MRRSLFIGLLIAITNFIQGQPLTGTKTIPGDYSTIAIAITQLNLVGTSAPGVTFNVASGYIEYGINIVLNTNTSSATAPIIFQKVPGGAVNPKINASSGVWNSTTDGGIIIAGSDYVTFDGIDINGTDNTVDWGYGLVKKSSTAPFDGCQNITIRNCNISLLNTVTCYGIYSGNHTATSTSALTITAVTDACNNCKFYNNHISNVCNGIVLNGYNAGSPYTLYDQGNEIGVGGANVVTNFGGGYNTVGFGGTYQNAITIANNSLNSNTYNQAPVYSEYGIYLGTGTTSTGSITNNTISLSLSTANSQSVYCIWTNFGNAGTTNNLNITNNVIQNCSYPNATSANFYGIYNTLSNNGPATINISNNSIHDVSIAGGGNITLIDAGNAQNINITNNSVYNITETGSGYVYAMRGLTGTITVHDNSVHDITVNSGSNPIYGYYNWASPTVESYYNNSFYNFTHNGTGAVYGMAVYTTAGTRQTYSNTVHTLSSAGGTVYGMYHQASTPAIYKNTIYDLTSLTATGIVYGLYLAGGSGVTIYNNYVSDLKTPASTNTNAVSGIYLNGSSTNYLHYNTIYLNATSSSTTTFGTSGVYANSNYSTELRNNIIVNKSTPVFTTGAAYTAAFMRNSTSLSNYATASNNNCFYAGTPGPNNVIYFDGTNADQSVSLLKVRVIPRESASCSELPPFVDAINHNFHIQPLVQTQVESTGTKITTPTAINTDFDNDTRWGEAGYAGLGTSTDLGSDEGNFTPSPAMTFQALTTEQVTGNTFAGTASQSVIRMKITVNGGASPFSVSQFTCNAAGTTAITDINATPAKIYYTGNSPSYGPGILFGSITPTIANFTIFGSQALVPGDNYFWLVYDVIQIAQTGNFLDGQCLSATISGTPTTPTVTSPAGNVMILGPMSGTYLVGTGNTYPNFTTITDAINHITHRGTGGPVVFRLTNPDSTPYNVANGETFPITIGLIPLSSAVNTTTFQPAPGISPVISGSSSTSIINMNGTDYFIIDGSNSGTATRNLLIENTSTGNWTAALQINSVNNNLGSTYCTIKNTIIRGGATGSPSMYTYACSVGAAVGSSGADNDNLTFDNNEFSRAYFSLYAAGTSNGVQDNCTMTNNTFGSDDPTCYIGNVGVYLSNISGTFTGNVIKGIIAPTQTTWGFYAGGGTRNMLIAKNDFHNIKALGNSNGGCGIVVETQSAGGNLTIANNIMYDISGDGSSNIYSYSTVGIKIFGISSNIRVYHNSINLSGYISRAAATVDLSAAIYIGNSVSQIDMRNNIFSNSIENTTGDAKAYAVYCAGPATVFSNADYNDYMVGGIEGVLSSYNGTDKTSLASWQTASGKDANSIAVNPEFNAPNVLIPYPVSQALHKCPILTVTDDYLNTTRTAPVSMGAYETGNDVTPPVVTYTPLCNTHQLTARTLTASITDYYSTVPTSGTGLPKLYWRINSNPYTAVTGVWTSGNTYQFTFGNWVAMGNSISYFIVCQDNMGTPNTGATPSAGASGFSANPPACTVPPSSPSSYMITGALSGVKNIPGDYPNLTGANGFFADINSKTLSGNLTVKILTNLTEDGTNALNEINTEDPSYQLTITNNGGYHIVSGSYSGALIRYNGVDNVILNGKGKILFSNANSYPSIALGMSGGCNNNIVDSCAFSAGWITHPANSGISITGPASNNQIRYDSVYKTYTGIYLNSGYWGLGSGNILYKNFAGANVPANYIFNNGIIAQYQDHLLISKNVVYNIIGNTSPIGIYTEALTNSVIEKNDIRDIVYNGSSYGGASGITFKSLSSSPNVMIRNNSIRHIAGMGNSPNAGDYNNIPAGLKLFGTALSGISLYNNSVYMNRDLSYGVFFNNEWFTALEVSAGISGVVLKNNILQNSVGEWPGSNIISWGYSIYTKGTGSPFASINNNLYFVSNQDNNYVGLNGVVTPPVNNMNLPAWQTFTGQDAQSLNVDPLYTSITNLAPQAGSPAIGAGLPVPGIVDDDINGNARGVSTTIGAFEMVPSSSKTLNVSLLIQGLSNGAGAMIASRDQAGIHWGATIADHITIELHDANPGNYANVIYTANDVVLNTAGNASAYIPAGLAGSYYVTIRHRNALPTVSAAPVSFSGVSIPYSFDIPAKAYGNKLVALPGGGYGIYSGDINQDGLVNDADKTALGISSGSFLSGYLSGDVNGDGTIDSADMTWVDNNATAGVVSSTP